MDRFGFQASQAAEANPMVAGLGVAEVLQIILATVIPIAVIIAGVALYGRRQSSKRRDDLHQDLQEQRQDIERREHRLGEREARLDTEGRHLEERADSLVAAESDIDTRRAGLLDICLLYTSDAADDLLCVDLGGRRIIKKKKI